MAILAFIILTYIPFLLLARMYTIIWYNKYNTLITATNLVLSITPIINIFYLLAVMYIVHDIEESADKFVHRFFKIEKE